MNAFEASLDTPDLSVFQYVKSQMTDGDRRSFLGLQQAVRDAKGPEGYVYLEIGSYLGGSLQPFVVDPRCRRIYSIDPRTQAAPDMRGYRRGAGYAENTTENMLKGLSRIPGSDLSKLVTLEEGSETLDPALIALAPDLCFIDGEHTDEAVLRDSAFCRRVMHDNGWIAFHDADVVYEGLATFLGRLQKEGAPFSAYNLEDSVFLIALGDRAWMRSAALADLCRASAKAYLVGLHKNDLYRDFYLRPVCRYFRAAERRLWKRFAKETTQPAESDEFCRRVWLG